MKLQIHHRFLVALAYPLLALDSHSALAIQHYAVQSLGGLVPYEINNSAQIVGINFVDNVGYTGGFLWVNSQTTPIAPPAPFDDQAPILAINNNEQIVIGGQVAQTNPPSRPTWISLIWNANNQFSGVDVPNGTIGHFGAINDLGQVGGNIGSISGNTPVQAAVWLTPELPTLLPFLNPNDTFGGVVALNDVGQAVGTSGWPIPSPLPAKQTVLWQNGTVIDLTAGHPFSNPTGINNAGQVIGWYFDYDTESVDVPFVWDAVHGLTVLPNWGGSSQPTAINQEGQIVGQAYDSSNSSSFAVLWDGGDLYDLNALVSADSGWVFEEADSINDRGQIVGWGSHNGQPQGFLLTPIPEPTEIVPAAGFLLLIGIRQRRRLSLGGKCN